MKYIHNYSSCSRTYATLRIYPKDIHPDVITNLLNIKPSHISVSGEKSIRGHKCVNGWFLSTKGILKSRDSRKHIDWILDKIQAVSKKIHELQKCGASMDVMCFWGSASGDGGPTISPDQMARLVKMNLEVWWDVYFEGKK